MAKKAKTTKSPNAVKKTLRAALIESAPAKTPRSWFEKLEHENPGQAKEIRAVHEEWLLGGDLRTSYPSRHALANAIALEMGVSQTSITRVFAVWER